MSRVVRAAVVGTGPRRLAAVPPDQVDPVVRDLIAVARAEAHAQGLEEGHARGEASAAARVAQLTDAVTAALDEVRRAAQRVREESVSDAVELAFAIAAAIVTHEPHDGGAAVAARIQETLAQLEDPSPVVHVSAEDVAVVTAALADHRSVVTSDPALGFGEARIRGGWADADLTRATAFAAIRRELGAHA